ncbi:MAG: S9 family peptidase [Candidatus Longimicrobiales bacterium M2_2A_002]
MRQRTLPAVLLLAAAVATPAATQEVVETYQTPAPELARLVDAPVTPGVAVSPDRRYLLLQERPSLPTIAEVSREELRIAGLRIDPRNNGPSRSQGYTSLTLKELPDGAGREIAGVPERGIRNVRFSPDGEHIAFTVDRDERIELWVASVAEARARRLTDRAVNDAMFGSPYDWMPGSGSLVARLVPEGRPEPPTEPRVPAGPVIQENVGESAPVRTYQDLLEDPHDEALFEHYGTSELVRLGLDGAARTLLEPRLLATASVSPDGRYVLAETIHRPFSYLVPAYRFPQTVEVIDAEDGGRVALIAELPLQENVPPGFGSVPTGARSVQWRADAPATLAWVEALDGGNARAEAEYRDRLFTLEAPFDGEPTGMMDLRLRYAGSTWGTDDVALVYESWFRTRMARAYVLDPSDPGESRVLFEYSYEEPYADPGRPVTHATDSGTSVLTLADDGQAIYLVGDGASPEGDRPFLRTMDLQTGETEELFRSEAPYYEEPVELLDVDDHRILTVRESPADPPNFFVRDLDEGEVVAQVTDFPHPYPELRGIRKELIQYERADGVPLTATLYLPPDYDAERDGPLPTFVWAYPREYRSAAAAGQVSDSPYRFNRVSYWGAIPYVLRGFAVLDDASIPIIGEGDAEPNDTFREQLVAGARAAVQEGVRRGVTDPDRVAIGGHSYGAFMTANLLAHSDIFRAGIARSGAYNRTLTPFGFQREERLYWEAPDVYYEMSPFMHADDLDEPILLIHGLADNNSGTFPVQSERYYHALKGLGKTVRLVFLPAESHGYRARESILHMLWETDRWLEEHVKNAGPREATGGD